MSNHALLAEDFVDQIVSILNLLQMGIEAILPPLKHLLLQFQISKVLSSFSDELLTELLFLLHDLLLNGLLVTSPLIGLIIDMMLLTL